MTQSYMRNVNMTEVICVHVIFFKWTAIVIQLIPEPNDRLILHVKGNGTGY